MISKTTRVVEEVSAHKDVSEREQKVRDTVRRQDVEVTPVGASRVGEYDNEFRRDFETRYAGQGYKYENYQPAYQYGSTCALDERYRNRDWTTIEPEVRRDWEARRIGPWEKVQRLHPLRLGSRPGQEGCVNWFKANRDGPPGPSPCDGCPQPDKDFPGR